MSMRVQLTMLKKIIAKLKFGSCKTKVSDDVNKYKQSEKKKSKQEEMKEETHQSDLKEGYEQDEEYEESKD